MKETIKSLVLVAASVFALENAHAQTEGMSLKACIDYALTNSPTLKIYENQVSIAYAQNKEGLAGYLPQVNGSVSFDDNFKRQTTIIPAGAFSPTPLMVQFGNQYAATVSGQLDQVVYNQSLINSIQASKVNVQLNEYQKEQNEIDVIYNTASAYYQVLILQQQLDLITNNEETIGELLKVQQLKYEKGALQASAFNRVKVNYNNVVSQKEQVEMKLKMALENLKNVLGMNPEQEISIENSVELGNQPTMPEQYDVQIKNRIEYRILETNIELQEFDLRRKRAQYIPTVGMYARYGANAFGNELNTTFDNWYDFGSVGLKVNVPIFSGMSKYQQVKQSTLNLDIMRQNLDLNSRIFALNLKNAQTQLNSSYLTLLSNKENLDLAESVYTETQLQYEKGAASLSDLLNADYARKEAQSNYINSMLNYYISRIDIEKSKGTLQEFTNNL